MKYETTLETSLVFSFLIIPHGFIGNILCSHSFISLINFTQKKSAFKTCWLGLGLGLGLDKALDQKLKKKTTQDLDLVTTIFAEIEQKDIAFLFD
jgi:hypothetical protein